MKQKTLFKLKDFGSEFGGALLNKRSRKIARPLSAKNAIHLVLRADASKSENLLKNKNAILHYLQKLASDFQLKIYEHALVSNHIHLTVRFLSRDLYKKFIRAFTGVLARRLKIKWLLRPYTRILKWGRALKTAMKYTKQNELEATGAIPYQPRPEDRRRTRWLLKNGHF